jgi:tryptophan synthase alpha chain
VTTRIDRRFAALKQEGRAALVTFVTAGDPDLATSAEVLRALVAAGADVVELGMPFTDPMADGASIQLGNLRSLGAGMKMRDLLAMVAEFRKEDDATPIILMGYFNPILAYGCARFAADAKAAGLDGTIVVDLPPEEAAELVPDLSNHGLHLIRLATPTTDAARLPRVLDGASGFLYYVAVAGVTGANAATAADVAAAVARLKRSTDLPIAVGFGVRTPEQAAEIAVHADAVVVGSAIVDTIANAAAERANDIPARVAALVLGLATAVRTARKQEPARAARKTETTA